MCHSLKLEMRGWLVFRGGRVALESCVAKVMTRVLAGMLNSENLILTEDQGGFRPG